jgi:hypothetical protein
MVSSRRITQLCSILNSNFKRLWIPQCNIVAHSILYKDFEVCPAVSSPYLDRLCLNLCVQRLGVEVQYWAWSDISSLSTQNSQLNMNIYGRCIFVVGIMNIWNHPRTTDLIRTEFSNPILKPEYFNEMRFINQSNSWPESDQLLFRFS